ncbi:YitT family protein, partial [Clostridioides difficile]
MDTRRYYKRYKKPKTLNSLFGVELWIVNLLLNVPLFIFAYKILSKKDCFKTVLGIIF